MKNIYVSQADRVRASRMTRIEIPRDCVRGELEDGEDYELTFGFRFTPTIATYDEDATHRHGEGYVFWGGSLDVRTAEAAHSSHSPNLDDISAHFRGDA